MLGECSFFEDLHALRHAGRDSSLGRCNVKRATGHPERYS